MRLTDRASAAATSLIGHYLTFLRPEAPVSCMRLLGCRFSMTAHIQCPQNQDACCYRKKIPECECNRPSDSKEMHAGKQWCSEHYSAVRCKHEYDVCSPPSAPYQPYHAGDHETQPGCADK